jgi:hypothetical protein
MYKVNMPYNGGDSWYATDPTVFSVVKKLPENINPTPCAVHGARRFVNGGKRFLEIIV